MRGNRNRPTNALDRARQVWRGSANLIRSDVRAAGVHGALRRLDDYARGHRGKETPAQLAALASSLRDAGVPLSVAQVRLASIGSEIADVIYADYPRAA